MNRRRFLQTGVAMGAAVATLGAGAVGGRPSDLAGAAEADGAVRFHSGRDMAGWTTVVGDGIWTPDGHLPVEAGDIAAHHYAGHTELVANVHRRPVMAHNTTFLRVDDADALSYRHTCRTEFRMPYVPSTVNTDENAETLEIAFFTWDGSDTRLDYGSGFQWVLNPWLESFGEIRVWSADGTEWIDSGHRIPLHRGWHDFDMVVDNASGRSSMHIDGTPIDIPFTATAKPADWGTETASRFAIETINAFPDTASVGATQRAQFRNWSWSTNR